MLTCLPGEEEGMAGFLGRPLTRAPATEGLGTGLDSLPA